MKTILITGALGGIGSILCKTFTEEGWEVIGMDTRVENSQAPYCKYAFNTNLHLLVQNPNYKKESLKKIREVLPDGLDVLINNAAVQRLNHFDDIKLSEWQETLNVNLTGPMLLSQELLDLLEQKNGSVINISSIHQQLTKRKFVTYATSKSALVGLTKAMAVDLQGRIRVNCISPAAVETDMLRAGFNNNEEAISELRKLHPSQSIGAPEEVAKCALFLTSEEVKFLNGANLQLDGGISSVLNDIR